MMIKPLTVVIKPTRNCNLRCTYCSVGDPESGVMSKEAVKTVIEKIVGRSSKSDTKFIWHGGEPLMAGMEFYSHVLEVQKPLKRAGHRITNVIQTNGTMITDKWAQFFKENRFGVGLSIDGPEDINNLTRVFANGAGSFVRIQAGAERLEKLGIKFGYLVVISHHSHDG